MSILESTFLIASSSLHFTSQFLGFAIDKITRISLAVQTVSKTKAPAVLQVNHDMFSLPLQFLRSLDISLQNSVK